MRLQDGVLLYINDVTSIRPGMKRLRLVLQSYVIYVSIYVIYVPIYVIYVSIYVVYVYIYVIYVSI